MKKVQSNQSYWTYFVSQFIMFISVSPELIELHVKLLRKIRKSVSAEKWERALIKFCHSYYISEDGWELERCGYNKCKIPNRLRILKVSWSL